MREVWEALRRALRGRYGGGRGGEGGEEARERARVSESYAFSYNYIIYEDIVGWMQERPISAPGSRTTYLDAGFKNDLSQTRFLFLRFCSGSTARL